MKPSVLLRRFCGIFWITICLLCGDGRSMTCDRESVRQISTNCSVDDFLLLCKEKVLCAHVSEKELMAKITINDGPGNTTRQICCTFPRLLAGRDGLVDCILFDTHYACPSSSAPVERRKVCDRHSCEDCLAGRKFASGAGFKCFKDGHLCGLPQLFLYDNVSDCQNGEDLCFSGINYSQLSDKCFQCPDGTIIPSNSVCDGIIDCPDLTDECLCENPIKLCQDLVYLPQRFTSSCKDGQISCGNGHCIHATEVCDGVIECPDERDERTSYCGPTLECNVTADTNPQECQCAPQCGNKDSNESSNSCYGHTFCLQQDIEDEEGSGSLPSARRCDGIVDCHVSAFDEDQCADFYICKGHDGQMISIPLRKICDFTEDCLDGVDEMNCSDHFYCNSGNVLFVRHYAVKDGRIDCDDGSDECNANTNMTNTYLFHSSTELIESRILYVLVWIMAIFALLGNFIIIIGQIRKLIKMSGRITTTASIKANHILVLNLAIADFLMGVYLFAVGIAYEKLRGSYCIEELLWRGSSVCTWMGVTALISVEASVLTLVLLTSCRFYTILKPYSTSAHPRSKLIIFLILLAWSLSSIAACVPLTEVFLSYFPDSALVWNNRFVGNSVISFTRGKTFLLRSLTFYGTPNGTDLFYMAEEIEKANTWNALASVYNDLPWQKEQLRVTARYGYYNKHSICLADLFPRWSDPYSGLSLSLVIFNFLAFLYMAAVYVAIYFLTIKKKRTLSDQTEAAKVQRKIFRIIFTNFLTWIPICILCFVRINSNEELRISGELYQVAAIVLLPINSSLNPFIYSSILPNLFKKVCSRVSSNFKQSSGRFESTDNLSATRCTTNDL